MAMSSTDELIQNVIDTMDNAHSQRMGLTDLLESLQLAKNQVKQGAEISKVKVSSHFEKLKVAVCDTLSSRMSQLLTQIDNLEQTNLEPLVQCEEMITNAIADAANCMKHGQSILADSPEENVEALLKFKDSPDSKNLNILPEVPSLCDVAFIDADLCDGLKDKFEVIVSGEGKIYERAPVHIMEMEERPGAIHVKWEEIDEELEAAEFKLQFCHGQVTGHNLSKVTFHTVYTGPNTHHLVKGLRVDSPYSFRVCGRQDAGSSWSLWSLPRTAVTHLKHYEWDDSVEEYSMSNENKTSTRTSGLTRVLYSKSACYRAGFPLTFRIMDNGEKSPVDGIGIAVTNEDVTTMKRDGAVFLSMDGTVYIDGQEMKTRLPTLSRNSCVTIETETLPNGKVRVSVQVGGKELTFDWKIDRQVTLGMIGGLGMTSPGNNTQTFFFAMHFSHEDWKIGVE